MEQHLQGDRMLKNMPTFEESNNPYSHHGQHVTLSEAGVALLLFESEYNNLCAQLNRINARKQEIVLQEQECRVKIDAVVSAIGRLTQQIYLTGKNYD
jgi:hypothetical protein